MNPMPSGARADEGGEGADAAAVGAGGGPERADMSGGAGEAFGRARAGAEAAMETAAAVLHGGLAALAAAAGAGAAARGGQEIAGAVAVLQMPATIGREGGGQGRGENRTMEPCPAEIDSRGAAELMAARLIRDLRTLSIAASIKFLLRCIEHL